ncbi:MAG: ribosomal protection-like ABC-F family protein [Candidatus Krumholzibacteriia bacterium]
MSIVSLQNASFDFGRERILHEANLSIFPGVKSALVGDNGAGKSTLLSLLTGELPLHGGTRQVAARAVIRLLRQETTFDAGRAGEETLYDSVLGAAYAPELALEAELAQVAAALVAARPDTWEELALRQGRLQAEYERLAGYTCRARLESALHGLGLPPALWGRTLGTLSGGERRRAALAAVLLAGGDLLLLDEPTNHLDLDACEWLEEFLLRLPCATVLVSHDRYFLDRVATRTLYLSRGRLTAYSGNYTFFTRARGEQERQELTAWSRQQERIRGTEDFIRRNLAGQKTKQAQSRRKLLAREERLERPPGEEGAFAMRLVPRRESGGLTFEVEGLARGFGDRPLWSGLDLLVARGDRLGIVGPNGCGKSTLLRLLAGLDLPDRGGVKIGHHVDLGYYDQHLRTVSDARTVLEEMAHADPAATVGELRGFLAAFGFGPDAFDRPVGALSGGERGRLALMRLIKEGHNTLLLDEPTNHLDVRACEALEAALAGFAGTLIVVSHDRRFLDRVAQRLAVFVPDPTGAAGSRVELFAGSYAQWREWQAELAARAPAAARGGEERSGGGARARGVEGTPAGSSGAAAALSKNERTRRLRWIAEAEAEIGRLESRRDDVTAELAQPRLAPGRVRELSALLAETEAALAERLALWEQWGREIEGATDG